MNEYVWSALIGPWVRWVKMDFVLLCGSHHYDISSIIIYENSMWTELEFLWAQYKKKLFSKCRNYMCIILRIQGRTHWKENKVFKGIRCGDRDHQTRANKGCLLLACWSWGVPSISSILQRLKAGRGVGKLHPRKKGRLHTCTDWRLLVGEVTVGTSEGGVFVSLVRGASLVSSDWSRIRRGVKIREAVSDHFCPGHVELLITRVLVWLPGLMVERVVWLLTDLT